MRLPTLAFHPRFLPTVLQLALLLALAPPAAADLEVVHQPVLAIPVVQTLDADLLTALGPITGHAELAHDEQGRIVAGGPCDIDGIPVEIKGRIRHAKKTGESTLKLVATNKAAGLKVTFQVLVVPGDAPLLKASFKSPQGKGKVGPGVFTVTLGIVEDPVATVALTLAEDGLGQPLVDEQGHLTVLAASLESDFDNLDPEAGTEVLLARLVDDQLRLRLRRGKARFVFKGVWFGSDDVYIGKTRLRFPPVRMKDAFGTFPGLVPAG